MSDQYYSAIQEQWSNIRGLYMAFGSKNLGFGDDLAGSHGTSLHGGPGRLELTLQNRCADTGVNTS